MSQFCNMYYKWKCHNCTLKRTVSNVRKVELSIESQFRYLFFRESQHISNKFLRFIESKQCSLVAIHLRYEGKSIFRIFSLWMVSTHVCTAVIYCPILTSMFKAGHSNAIHLLQHLVVQTAERSKRDKNDLKWNKIKV